ncbi:MAG: hypothetical protein HQL57_01330 [Magnetococcales bacterium]|nr:hypothetical protein [Magnetococcales bacterium]MBF0155813.1 hypothetical protein [Magnetococcales bacterium]
MTIKVRRSVPQVIDRCFRRSGSSLGRGPVRLAGRLLQFMLSHVPFV